MQEFEEDVDTGMLAGVVHGLPWAGAAQSRWRVELGFIGNRVLPVGEEGQGLVRQGAAWARVQRCERLGVGLWKVRKSCTDA